MEIKNPISIQELDRLLSDASTAAPTLESYFVFHQDRPFSGEYRLRDGIAVYDEGEKEGYENLGKYVRKEAVFKANSDAIRRRNKIYDEAKRDKSRIRIVSEGDSWFQYPKFQFLGLRITKGVKDVIDHLIADDRYCVKSLDAGGDLLRNMYHQRAYIDAIREEQPHFFLLSAGGNDFFEVFPTMLQENPRPDKIEGWLGRNFRTELDVLQLYYQSLLRELTETFPHLHIIIHGYDYIIPRNEGKWIGGPMLDIGIGRNAHRKALINYIMDELNSSLANLAATPAFKGKVHYLNVRESVPQELEWWHDEIHPGDRGFGRVAEKFKNKINSLAESIPA